MAELVRTKRTINLGDSIERRPIYVHQDIDDLPLTVEAFRVYMHLSRRSGKKNRAWPSYTSIGEHCFRNTYPSVQSASLRRKAIRAVGELETIGVIEVVRRKTGGHSGKGNKSNVYRILPRSEWKPELLKQLSSKEDMAENFDDF